MKTVINNRRKIFSIQEEFSALFPYLKLEFYAKSHTEGGPSSDKAIQHSSKTLGECRIMHEDGIITITPNMTVAELEDIFGSVYGLKVHVYRKAGNSWLETAVTNDWSLEEQNKQGETLSKEVI